MPRFDPERYPDRLVFEAYAKRIRAQEMDRLLAAARTWLRALRDDVVHALVRPMPGGVHARRHSHH